MYPALSWFYLVDNKISINLHNVQIVSKQESTFTLHFLVLQLKIVLISNNFASNKSVCRFSFLDKNETIKLIQKLLAGSEV